MRPIENSESPTNSLIQTLRTRWRATLLLGIGVSLLGFGGIQLVPVDRTNPPTTCEINWISVEARTLAVNACYDCHSNATEWPWYAKIAPVSWRVASHVDEGREYINFSEWDLQRNPERLVDDIEDVILNNAMPTWDYRLIHAAAKLTEGEKQQLIDGFARTVRENGNSCAD